MAALNLLPFTRRLLGQFRRRLQAQRVHPTPHRPQNLGAAAFQVHAGIKSVDDTYLRKFIALLKEVPDVGQVFIDCLEHMKTTGLFLTPWAKFDYAGLNWGVAMASARSSGF